jgi:nicotinate phosphoribosyltransferase
MDGIGTNLTNDVGIQPLNIVMKATRVEIPEGEAKTVKTSDDEGKQIGPPRLVDEYRNQHFKAA